MKIDTECLHNNQIYGYSMRVSYDGVGKAYTRGQNKICVMKDGLRY